MTYIHQQPDWPNFGWDNDQLSSQLAALRYQQGQLIGRMQSLGFELTQQASLQTLTHDVVRSALIEGEKLNTDEVRSSIARGLGMDIGGLVTSSRNVDGIVAMMLDATQNYSEPLSAERLCGWHELLFPTGRAGMQTITVGNWRPESAGPMQVISGPYGKRTVHFEAPNADRLATEMAQFLQWFKQPNTSDPVVKAAIAHFWFVTIHPFEDGNGRIARAIADLCLARADNSKQRFYSMSTQIETERQTYYQQLEAQQRGNLDITPWLSWFLACLERAIHNAENQLDAILYKARLWQQANQHPVNERQRKVINRMLADDWQGHLNTSKYAKLAKCSNDTALRDIRDLLTMGVLIKNEAGGRSTSYRLINLE